MRKLRITIDVELEDLTSKERFDFRHLFGFNPPCIDEISAPDFTEMMADLIAKTGDIAISSRILTRGSRIVCRIARATAFSTEDIQEGT